MKQYWPPWPCNYNSFHNNLDTAVDPGKTPSLTLLLQTYSIMHDSIKRSYLLPAIFLNPVLFLHSVNTILSRILPPIVVSSALQPPPFSGLGPSATHPHLDVHSSESFCWSYTIVMVCAQLVAFGRVSQFREEDRERRKAKERAAAKECAAANNLSTVNGDVGCGISWKDPPNGHGRPMNGGQDLRKRSIVLEETYFD